MADNELALYTTLCLRLYMHNFVLLWEEWVECMPGTYAPMLAHSYNSAYNHNGYTSTKINTYEVFSYF